LISGQKNGTFISEISTYLKRVLKIKHQKQNGSIKDNNSANNYHCDEIYANNSDIGGCSDA